MDNRTKLLCLERELRLRRRVYPRWVELGKMKMHQAEYEIEVMEAIANDYHILLEQEEPGLFTAGNRPAKTEPT
jgi:hypothetical protein